MLLTNTLFFAALASATAAPLHKRIAQVIVDATAPWSAACTAAGGGVRCQPAAQAGFMALLAGADACAQQDAADAMLALARALPVGAPQRTMVRLTQVFAQQPRNAPDARSVPYCQRAPRAAALAGLFQCQFAGTDPAVFAGGAARGAPGTVPLGRARPVDPPGACAAHPGGAIPDGTQLVDLTQDPGVGTDGTADVGGASAAESGSDACPGGGAASEGTPSASYDPSADSAPGGADVSATDSGASNGTTTASADPNADASTTDVGASNASPEGSADAGAGADFKLQNGKDAQAQNARFASLTPVSPCDAAEAQACVGGAFAQCVGGAFVTTACAGGTQCFALPLVNKAGTSIACTTAGDAAARVAATGAGGGVAGAGA